MDKSENQKSNSKIEKALEDFGGLIREFRLNNNLSLQDTAELFGCSPSYVWRIEKNKRNPELDFRIRVLLIGVRWSPEDIHSYLEEIILKEKMKGMEC